MLDAGFAEHRLKDALLAEVRARLGRRAVPAVRHVCTATACSFDPFRDNTFICNRDPRNIHYCRETTCHARVHNPKEDIVTCTLTGCVVEQSYSSTDTTIRSTSARVSMPSWEANDLPDRRTERAFKTPLAERRRRAVHGTTSGFLDQLCTIAAKEHLIDPNTVADDVIAIRNQLPNNAIDFAQAIAIITVCKQNASARYQRHLEQFQGIRRAFIEMTCVLWIMYAARKDKNPTARGVMLFVLALIVNMRIRIQCGRLNLSFPVMELFGHRDRLIDQTPLFGNRIRSKTVQRVIKTLGTCLARPETMPIFERYLGSVMEVVELPIDTT